MVLKRRMLMPLLAMYISSVNLNPAISDSIKLEKTVESTVNYIDSEKVQFVEFATPYIMDQHGLGVRWLNNVSKLYGERTPEIAGFIGVPRYENIPKDRARQYATWIYDAAKIYDISYTKLLSLINHESNFVNMRADLNSQNGPSESLCMILRSTKKTYWRDFVSSIREAESNNMNIPFKLYEDEWKKDITLVPHKAIYLSAFILKSLLDSTKTERNPDGDFELAVQYYNTGRKLNQDYLRKVEAREKEFHKFVEEVKLKAQFQH